MQMLYVEHQGMNWLGRLFNKRRLEADLHKELSFHLEQQAADHARTGLTEQEARRNARLEFGGAVQIAEECREARGTLWLESILQDLRYGVRAMRQSPGFTSAAVLTLALGIGANTAIFSLIDTVMLRSLPVQEPSSLYFLRYAGPKGIGVSPPYPCFERIRSQAKSITGIAAYAGGGDLKIQMDGRVEQVSGRRVSGDYHRILGLTPIAGRLLTSADEKLDPPTAVISFDYWQQRFEANPNTIGKTFVLDGNTFTIVGVTPGGFYGLQPGHKDDVTIPITTMRFVPPAGAAMLVDPRSPWFESIVRLKPGVLPQQAQAESDAIFQGFMSDFPSSSESRRDYLDHIELSPASHGLDELRKCFSRPLEVLMAMVGLVLLIACVNITSLLLVRAAKRQREFAVRLAIGAGRGRLARQLFVETTMLFFAGAVAGVICASWVTRALAVFLSSGSRPILLDVHWDSRVLGFTAALSLLVSLVFGAAPILRATRTDPHMAMKDGSRASASRGRMELGRLLVAFQISLSLILLVGASLFVRTLRNLQAIDPGFRPSQVLLMSVQLMETSYPEDQARIAEWSRMLSEIRSLPGLQSASLSAMTPLDTMGRRVGFTVPGFQPRSDQDRFIGLNTVSEDYFTSLGIPIVRGRAFTENDRQGRPNVAMLNESAVRHFFTGRDPVGTVVSINDHPCRIIGVVQDTKDADLRKESGRYIYISVRQPYDQGFRMTLSVSTQSDPQSLIPAVTRRIYGTGSGILVTNTRTLVQQFDESLLQERLVSILATSFGVLALVLSAVGLWGVLAYSVARRTSEIGIRMALGARPGQVVWGILRQTLWVVAIGLAAGIPASIFLARLVQSLLYGVTPADTVSQASSAILLAVVAVVASYLPARSASRIDPLTTLRHE
jgi:predicted permease